VLSYYKAELSHTIHSNNLDPRFYSISAFRAFE
jgi:hypothetical protein